MVPVNHKQGKKGGSMEPGVKVLMGLTRHWLMVKAKEFNVSTEGTKEDIAKRIRRKEQIQEQRAWKIISGG